MSTQRQISSEDLALFAMQLLSKEESAEIAAYLDESAEGRRELAEVHGELAIYAHTVDLHSPPAQTRERLMKQVAREKKAVPMERAPVAETPERTGSIAAAASDEGPREGFGRGLGSGAYLTEDDRPKRSAGARALPWIGWALAAGSAVAAGELYHEREILTGTVKLQASRVDHVAADAAVARDVLDAMTDSSAMRVTLTTKSQKQQAQLPQGRAIYIANKGTLIFLAGNLEQLDASKTYELWLIPVAESQTPIPAGTFRPDEHGNASVIMPPLPKGVEAKAFGVTVEDVSGATTPTLPIILVGE